MRPRRMPLRFESIARWTAVLLLGLGFTMLSSRADAEAPILVGLGDSISEGVQSADASWMTQPFTYLNWVALKMGVPFPLPLIQSGPLGVVNETTTRFRLNPSVGAFNLAVSGADVDSLLNERADATTVDAISSETDLVLFPRLGSQIEVAEALRPALIVCWIGNNDVLRTATSWDRLDASQMTSVEVFSDRFNRIADRLGALGSAVVFANIPDVTTVGFLLDRQDLTRFLGSDFGLAGGSYTTLIAMLIVRLGLNDGSLLKDPQFVLDAGEVARVQERIDIFNSIIAAAAARIDAQVVDVNALFKGIVANSPLVLGIPLTHRFLGGIFSLDGLHPSNIAHAVLAIAFIDAINAGFRTAIPQLTPFELWWTALTDPFWDKDGDGRASGRPFAGLLETLAPFLGISGDPDDFGLDARVMRLDPKAGPRFMERYRALQGLPPQSSPEWDWTDVKEAFNRIFGVRRAP